MEVGKYFLSMKTKAAHNLFPFPSLPFCSIHSPNWHYSLYFYWAKHLANTQASATLRDLDEGLVKLPAD